MLLFGADFLQKGPEIPRFVITRLFDGAGSYFFEVTS